MIDYLIQTVLIGASAWRVAALISYERGPGAIFMRFRELLGFQHDDEGHPTTWPDNILANLVACIWCLGLWATGGLMVVWWAGELGRLAIVALAAAALVIIMEKVIHGKA